MIYAYWEGPRHWYYDLCWETVLQHNPGAILIGPREAAEAIGPMPRAVADAYVVHRVDWIRKKFIAARGGLWLDMDFVCFESLAWLSETTLDYLGWREWHGTGWMDNLFAARKGSPILIDAADYALRQMEMAGKDATWLSTNADAMNYALGKHAWAKWMQIPTHLIGPVSVTDVGWFVSPCGTDNVNDFAAIGFMTSVHGIGGWLSHFPGRDEFLASDSHVAALVRRGLGI